MHSEELIHCYSLAIRIVIMVRPPFHTDISTTKHFQKIWEIVGLNSKDFRNYQCNQQCSDYDEGILHRRIVKKILHIFFNKVPAI